MTTVNTQQLDASKLIQDIAKSLHKRLRLLSKLSYFNYVGTNGVRLRQYSTTMKNRLSRQETLSFEEEGLLKVFTVLSDGKTTDALLVAAVLLKGGAGLAAQPAPQEDALPSSVPSEPIVSEPDTIQPPALSKAQLASKKGWDTRRRNHTLVAA